MDFSVSVIIPVYNGGENFKKCIDSLALCVPPPEEIIVVADSESDRAYLYAQERGHKTIILQTRNGKLAGPSAARNKGASIARGNLLLFIDADVVVRKDIIGQVISTFYDNKDLDALIGSYNDLPKERGIVSQYKNLQHHYIHQISNEKASTFWGACGAIKSEMFNSIGGFCPDYTVPSVEDIELGYRLIQKGKQIKLKKDIQVTHLKKWGFWSMIKTDVMNRAIPWSKLILHRDIPYDLNISLSARVSTLTSLILVISFLFCVVYGLPHYSYLVLLCCGVLFILNRGFYSFLLRKKGIKFLLCAIPLHWLYYFYSGIAYVYTMIRAKLVKMGMWLSAMTKPGKQNY